MLWMVVPTPMTCLLPHPGLFFLLQQILCSFISNFSLVFSFSFVEGDLHQMVTAWCFSFFVCVFPSFSSSWMFSLSLQLLECLGCLGQCCKGRLSSVHFDDPSSWVVHDPFVLEENLFLTLFITSSLGAAFTNLTMIDRGWGGVKWGGGGFFRSSWELGFTVNQASQCSVVQHRCFLYRTGSIINSSDSNCFLIQHCPMRRNAFANTIQLFTRDQLLFFTLTFTDFWSWIIDWLIDMDSAFNVSDSWHDKVQSLNPGD